MVCVSMGRVLAVSTDAAVPAQDVGDARDATQVVADGEAEGESVAGGGHQGEGRW